MSLCGESVHLTFLGFQAPGERWGGYAGSPHASSGPLGGLGDRPGPSWGISLVTGAYGPGSPAPVSPSHPNSVTTSEGPSAASPAVTSFENCRPRPDQSSHRCCRPTCHLPPRQAARAAGRPPVLSPQPLGLAFHSGSRRPSQGPGAGGLFLMPQWREVPKGPRRGPAWPQGAALAAWVWARPGGLGSGSRGAMGATEGSGACE